MAMHIFNSPIRTSSVDIVQVMIIVLL